MRRTWRCWFSHGSLALPKIEASVDAVEAASSSLACMMTSARTGLGLAAVGYYHAKSGFVGGIAWKIVNCPR